jgi:hypothetical protein
VLPRSSLRPPFVPALLCVVPCSVVNLVFACILFPAAAVTAGVTAYRGLRSVAAGKRWTQRRRRLFGLYAGQVSNLRSTWKTGKRSNPLGKAPNAPISSTQRKLPT